MKKKLLHKNLILLFCLSLLVGLLYTGDMQQVQAASGEPFVIVLDPGHDTTHGRGKNKASGIVEETVNLEIAQSLKKKLESYGFTVLINRGASCPAKSGADATECNRYRTSYAAAVGADLYISLHLNASGGRGTGWKTGTGSSIYITNYSKYKSSMSKLASKISSHLKSDCGVKERTPKGIVRKTESDLVYDDGSDADYYGVIKEATYRKIPAILIEHAFMDSKNDSEIIKKKGASSFAAADCAGIVEWYKETYGSLPTSGTVGYVSGEKLNLRSSASAKAKSVVTLTSKDPVVIYGSAKGWYQVVAKHNGKSYKGYVSDSYIKKGVPSVTVKSAIPGSAKKNTGSSSSTTAGYVDYAFLNLRKSASTSSSIVCRLDRYDSLKIYSHSDHWYKVEATHKGKTYSGYVYDSYVKKGTSTSDSGSYTTDGYVNYDFLNLRSEPNKSSKLVVKLDRYDTLKLGRKSNGWYPVQATHKGKTYTGYVYGEYVATGSAPGTGYVNYQFLNVRDGAGTGNKKIDELSKNDTVTIVSSSGGWYKICYTKDGKEKTGYVMASYITRK